MARARNGAFRDDWYARQIDGAPTFEKKVHLLHGKLLSDITRLPEQRREEAFELAATMLSDVIDEVEIRRIDERWAT